MKRLINILIIIILTLSCKKDKIEKEVKQEDNKNDFYIINSSENETLKEINSSFKFYFNKNLDTNSINSNILLSDSNIILSTKIQYDTSDFSINITSIDSLKFNTEYNVSFFSTLMSLDGDSLTPFIKSYKTKPLTFEIISVTDTTLELNLSPTIEIQFNKILNEYSINNSTIFLKINNEKIQSLITYEASSKKITITPKNLISTNTEIELHITDELYDLDEQNISYFIRKYKTFSKNLNYGKIGHFKFTQDYSDSENIQNNISGNNTTLVNNHVKLSNKGSYLSFGKINRISDSPENWSYSVWIKLDSIPTNNNPVIFSPGLMTPMSKDLIFTYYDSSQQKISLRGKVDSSGEYSPSNLEVNKWYLITSTLENSLQKTYLNDKLIGINSSLPFFDFKKIQILSLNSWTEIDLGFDPTLYGNIDDILVYNRPLGLDEIKDIYLQSRSN